MTVLVKQLQENLREKEQVVETLDTQNRVLKQRIQWLEKQLFGAGKSEKQDAAQLQLGINEDQQEAQREQASKKELVVYEREKKGKKRRSREEAFEHLPVKETLVIIPDEVKAQPDEYVEISEEETSEVHYDPAKLYRIVTIRKKYRRIDKPEQAPIIAPAKPCFMQGSYVSISLALQVVLDKYKYHNPLYRQEDKFKQMGTPISRQSMCGWVAQTAWWLKPLYDYLGKYLITLRYLQADETPMEYIDKTQKHGKAQRGQLWTFGRPYHEVIFLWHLDRKHKHVADFLEGFEGLLQSDGYQAYTNLAKSNKSISLVCCLAHVRRYYYEALKEQPLKAKFIMRLIGNLYYMEDQWKAQGWTPEQITQLRKRDFPLVLNLIKRVIDHYEKKVTPSSLFGKAITYTKNNWPQILELLNHGHAHLDNNHEENAIRPLKLGAKNYLFFGSPEAGHNSAILYTFIVSCQRLGIDPKHYLEDVLERLIAKRHTNEELHQLLPSQWKAKSAQSD